MQPHGDLPSRGGTKWVTADKNFEEECNTGPTHRHQIGVQVTEDKNFEEECNRPETAETVRSKPRNRG
jgi:hypothetical protein